MKKYIVETYYTCTFKTVHSLENLNDNELSKIDNRTDGEVEVIDVKLNNRKTRKTADIKNNKIEEKSKTENSITKSISKSIIHTKNQNNIENAPNLKIKINPDLNA